MKYLFIILASFLLIAAKPLTEEKIMATNGGYVFLIKEVEYGGHTYIITQCGTNVSICPSAQTLKWACSK